MAKKTGIQKPKELSEAMADFMGKDSASRADVISALWKYIKKHKLQDPDNKRQIIFDDYLGDILGVTKTDMFKLAGLISEHFVD